MKKGARVALVTSREDPDLAEDDRLLPPELARRGIAASAQVWDERSTDWGAFDAIILRSTWDYHLRDAEFRLWVEARQRERARLWNPAPLVLWNMHKFYLRDLREKGVAVVPTRFLPAGSRVSLDRILDEEGWGRAVVKPAVSSTAFRTHRIDRGSAAGDSEARRLVSERDALVQQYMPQIETEGELSFIHMEGAFSHAVRKQPLPGDFRVQEQFGGSATPETPDVDLVPQAAAVLAAIESPWLYARVDCVQAGAKLLLMELELVEPTLYLLSDPGAVRRFADAIENRVVRS